MTHLVQFPNLGISVEINPVALQFGDFKIYWYGILIGIGFLLAILYGFSSCKKMNINKDHLFDAIIAGLIGGIIGARLYYVIFYPGDKYLQNPMEVFNIKEGGLGIYGGIIGGLLCGALVAKWRKMRVFAVLDVASLGYLIGQCIGRWGNFVNQEAFGCATNLPWGMYSDRTAEEVVGNVHPCFLYESLLCLLGFILLHFFTRHLRRYDGQTFLLYIVWYGVTRFFIEGLRTDSLLLPGIDLRVSQVLAAVSALVAIVLLIVFRKCSKLSGCGSRRVMEANGIQLEEQSEQFDSGAESTILSGMSAEEAAQQLAVRVKKSADLETQDEEAEEEQTEESEEKTDGSAN
ncbi:prolipoprotein diacylglyceryl transferase [Anaeromassilibacillus senegalensis]|uniref:Phosphatidylglycerol--prolipoprotein diacylglyceryl transferase n=1 Tax=Anaeromassilibacillus senegalensis TaxID=1673717 RepID=A0ABS9CNL9_9FIRM|nr:prolipoprotein diacylglyceryl transferase [Anaeromassilibacillus senegalensis]MCF2651767.1 prolipoprotein diacylglyceryl transferase [Anaeromassilibacillus senegalensis]